MCDYNEYLRVVKFQNLMMDFELSFKSNKIYQSVLEHTTQASGNFYLNNIKNEFSALYEKNKDYFIDLCVQNDKYGKPQLVGFNNFCVCSPSNLKYIYQSLIILSNIKNNKLYEVDIIEIGGGYGGLCFFIYNLAKLFNVTIKSYTIFDLNEVIILQKRYVKIHGIDINTYNIDDEWMVNENSYLISNYAFSEIPMELQIQYTDKILNKYISYGFLIWNFIPLYDFIKNKKITIESERPAEEGKNKFVYITPA